MSIRWHYSHDGATHGPYSQEELKAQAAKGLVRPEDRIWREGTDRASGTTALAAIDFDHLPIAALPAPDWLADVEHLQATGPVPPPQRNPDPPEWLHELRLWYGLEALALAREATNENAPSLFEVPTSEFLKECMSATAPPRTPAMSPSAAPVALPYRPPPPASPSDRAETRLPTPCDLIPEWLADFLPEAQPLPPPSSAPKVASPPAPTTKEPTTSTMPVPPPSVSKLPSPTAPTKPARTPSAAPAIPIAVPIAQPMPLAIATVVSLPPSIKMTTLGTPKALTRLAEQAMQETGFDLRTGQIVNPAQLEKWKHQQAHPGAAARAPTPSIMEVFRKARTAIENWVDDEKHRPLILEGNIAAIEREPEIQAILLECSKYGSPMLEKLQAHLPFLVENRRKYHAAYSAYFGSAARK